MASAAAAAAAAASAAGVGLDRGGRRRRRRGLAQAEREPQGGARDGGRERCAHQQGRRRQAGARGVQRADLEPQVAADGHGVLEGLEGLGPVREFQKRRLEREARL